MTKRPRRLLLHWLVATGVALALPVAFVAAVDPFGYFGTNTVGFYYSSERQFKTTLVRTATYNAIVLGDSRVAFANPALIDLPQYKFLNGGIGGGTFSEQVELLLNSKLEDLDLVVVGLAHRTLSVESNCRQDPTSERSPWDPIRFAASWTQVWYAASALQARRWGVDPYYHPDGTRVSAYKDREDSEFVGKNARYWRIIAKDSEGLDQSLKNRRGIDVEGECLKLVERVRGLAREHGFRLVLVFLPINRDLLDRADWKTFLTSERSRRSLERLRSITPHVVNFIDSAYSDSANFWRHDPTHFRPEVGARLIEEAIRISEDGAAALVGRDVPREAGRRVDGPRL